MNNSTQTLLRSLLKIGGGFLVAKGLAADDQVEAATAGVLALAAVVWGLLHRTTPAPASSAGGKIPLMLLAGALLSSSAAVVLLPGCAATPSRVAYNVAAVPAVTLDQAMTAWGDYVHQFPQPAATELKVKAAYEKAQAAEAMVIDSAQGYADLVKAGSTNSITARLKNELSTQTAANALADLVNLLSTLGVKL